ncbi:MAG TPA: hypothetical protein PL110_17750 [Candidatus Eremiobacteraeota bacterium]|nr:hypothetical protein [Candidatus Eremiobacteraeota bacterium]
MLSKHITPVAHISVHASFCAGTCRTNSIYLLPSVEKPKGAEILLCHCQERVANSQSLLIKVSSPTFSIISSAPLVKKMLWSKRYAVKGESYNLE